MLRAATLVLLAAAWSGCGGDEAPVAEIVDHAPSTLTPGDDALDDLSLEVHYTDADGDLGEGAVEVLRLAVAWCRGAPCGHRLLRGRGRGCGDRGRSPGWWWPTWGRWRPDRCRSVRR